jgi:hypothetical protein
VRNGAVRARSEHTFGTDIVASPDDSRGRAMIDADL